MDLKNNVINFERKTAEFFKSKKVIIIWTVLITLATHIYFFMGRYGNEDSRFHINDTVSVLSSGRYFYGFTKFDFVPVIIFVLILIELTISVLLVLGIFKIKSKTCSLLIAGFMVTFPVLGYSFSYIQMYDTYTLALLFSVLAVYCSDKWKYGFLAGGVFLFFSLTLYQAYIQVSMGLCAVILLCMLIDKDLKAVGLKAVRFIAFGIIGFILYKAGISVFGIELSDYAGIDSMGEIPLSQIPELITRVYEEIYEFFTSTDSETPIIRFFYIPMFVFISYILFILFSAVIIIKEVKTKEVKRINRFFIALGFLLFPFALNFTGLAVFKAAKHSLMVYSFVIIFLIPFIFINTYPKSIMGGGYKV